MTWLCFDLDDHGQMTAAHWPNCVQDWFRNKSKIKIFAHIFNVLYLGEEMMYAKTSTLDTASKYLKKAKPVTEKSPCKTGKHIIS